MSTWHLNFRVEGGVPVGSGMISGYGVDVLLTVAKIHPLPLKTQYFIVLISPSEFWGIWFLGCYPLQHAALDFERSQNALKIFGISGNPKHAWNLESKKKRWFWYFSTVNVFERGDFASGPVVNVHLNERRDYVKILWQTSSWPSYWLYLLLYTGVWGRV